MAIVVDLGPLSPEGSDRRVAHIYKHAYDGVLVSIWIICQIDKPKWSVISEFKELTTNSLWHFGNFVTARDATQFLLERGYQWLQR